MSLSFRNYNKLFIFTSTYGDGEAPDNADNFLNLLRDFKTRKVVEYSVLGFGSTSYEHYCKFAYDVDFALSSIPNVERTLNIQTVNNSYNNDMISWLNNLFEKTSLDLRGMQLKKEEVKETYFYLVKAVKPSQNDTFLMHLRPYTRETFISGDLLSIIPHNSSTERLYSIGKLKKELVLSVKKHDMGVCSSFLFDKKEGDFLKAKVVANQSFYLPNEADHIIMISNGTGIAPFLGMISDKANKRKNIHLFWGGKNQQDYLLYSSIIQDSLDEGILSSLHIAYSRENSHDFKYVQDCVKKNIDFVLNCLSNNGVIMICGSLDMKNDVVDILSLKDENRHLKDKVLTDCY